jgi:hypothetical protein
MSNNSNGWPKKETAPETQSPNKKKLLFMISTKGKTTEQIILEIKKIIETHNAKS